MIKKYLHHHPFHKTSIYIRTNNKKKKNVLSIYFLYQHNIKRYLLNKKKIRCIISISSSSGEDDKQTIDFIKDEDEITINKNLNENIKSTSLIHDSSEIKEKNLERIMIEKSSIPLSRPIVYPSWYDSMNGIVLACAVLLAIKFGRHENEAMESHNDITKIEEELMASENVELSKRRKNYTKQQALLKEIEIKKNIEDVKKKSEEAAIERRERERKYKLEQEREKKRITELKAKEKKIFEEKEKAMSNELLKRTEMEIRIKQEMEEKRKQEEIKRKRIEEEKRRIEIEKEKEEERKRQKELEVMALKMKKEKELLEKQKQKFAVRIEGTINLTPSEKGSKTSGIIIEDAKYNIKVKTKTVLNPKEEEFCQDYAKIEDIKEDANMIVGNVIKRTIDNYISSVHLQAMTNTGPLNVLSEVEFNCWMRLSILRTISIASYELNKLLNNEDKFNKTIKFQVRTEWGILPRGHERRNDNLINKAFDLIISNNKVKAREIINEIIKNEYENYFKDLDKNLLKDLDKNLLKDLDKNLLKYTPKICLYVYINEYAQFNNNGTNEIVNGCNEIINDMIRMMCDSAPLDTLHHEYSSLEMILGKEEDNKVVELFKKYCERNKSKETKNKEIEKKRLLQERLLQMRVSLLEEEWPDKEQMAEEIAREKESQTPIVERVWALRNVSRTLGMNATSESSMVQAIELSKKALTLQLENLKEYIHPGMIGPLMDYAMIIGRSNVMKDELIKAWEDIGKILELIAERYRKQEDFYSAILCAESGLLAMEEILGSKNQSIKKFTKSIENWTGLLDDNEIIKLSNYRKNGNGLQHIASCFTSELSVYKNMNKKDRIEQWNDKDNLKSL